MWLMLQQEKPDDYVIATGISHSVRQFLEHAFVLAGLDYKNFLQSDMDFFRPSEINVLCGNASKAKTLLGWQPTVDFAQLVEEMVKSDLDFCSHQP
jgi:GDPmannose 4,6-dehydratase